MTTLTPIDPIEYLEDLATAGNSSYAGWVHYQAFRHLPALLKRIKQLEAQVEALAQRVHRQPPDEGDGP